MVLLRVDTLVQIPFSLQTSLRSRLEHYLMHIWKNPNLKENLYHQALNTALANEEIGMTIKMKKKNNVVKTYLTSE